MGAHTRPRQVCNVQQQQLQPLLQQLQQQLLPLPQQLQLLLQLLLQQHPQQQHPLLLLLPLPQPQQQIRMRIRMIQIQPLSLFHIVCHLTYQSETYYAGARQKAA